MRESTKTKSLVAERMSEKNGLINFIRVKLKVALIWKRTRKIFEVLISVPLRKPEVSNSRDLRNERETLLIHRRLEQANDGGQRDSFRTEAQNSDFILEIIALRLTRESYCWQ